MIDTIIFDGEGVVVDTESIWDQAQEAHLRLKGRAYDRGRVKHLLSGKSQVESAEVLKREYRLTDEPQVLASERQQLMRALLEQQVDFVPGFKQFFENVREQYKTCIATAMDDEMLRIIDERLQLLDLFDDNVFNLSQVSFVSKPAPDLFLFAAMKLESRPNACLVIEDSPVGVEAARRAGMLCIGLTTTFDRATLQAADLVLDSFDQVDLTAIPRNSQGAH